MCRWFDSALGHHLSPNTDQPSGMTRALPVHSADVAAHPVRMVGILRGLVLGLGAAALGLIRRRRA